MTAATSPTRRPVTLAARNDAARARRSEALTAIGTGLSVEDAAARYAVTERTVRRWIRDAGTTA